MVLANGAPVEMPWVRAPRAIVEAYLGGQAGGSAIADILFGRCNPSGKLAETFPMRQSDVAADRWFPGTDRQVQYREGLYVGYRYFDTFGLDVLFPFGHGLSYTDFHYDNLEIALNQEPLSVDVAFTLANVGRMEGAEIVQLYVHNAGPGVHRPEQELKAFRRVVLKAGERQRVSVRLDGDAFACYHPSVGDWVVESGKREIRIGASSRDIRLRYGVLMDAAPTSVVENDLRPAFTAGRLVVDDNTFAAMLGGPVPAVESVQPFHINSTFAEISKTWLGRKFAEAAKAQFSKRMGGDIDGATRRMVEMMVNDMPLRLLPLFSGGRVSRVRIEALTALLNRRYLRALKLLAT